MTCPRLIAPIVSSLLVFTFAGSGCGPSSPGLSEAPLQTGSPWPKFRYDLRQDGRSPLKPPAEGGALWSYRTAKGIFSSPVVAGDGTIYVGSADRTFYALRPDGTLRWSKLTGEIIDSAALLDDLGRVYFASGDGYLYALDAESGAQIWSFQAEDPAINNATIRWWEGNVGITADGTLLAGNDNYFLYGLDRRSGQIRWRHREPSVVWSLPAVDRSTGRLFVGNVNLLPLLGSNTFGLDANGQEVWSQGVLGSIAASPALAADGTVLVGGYDGLLRAYGSGDGRPRWSFATRAHIYASPAIAADGTILQPSGDGTLYALNPDGTLRWAFDTREPIRSSPAIDGDGNIYVGNGEGRLWVLNPDGTLRWARQLIADDRNDLNASVALGKDAVYIAGESGEIFSVPYDYCLRAAGAEDPACIRGPGEDLPADGTFLYFTTPFGALVDPPATINANQPLAFSLLVRSGGDTQLTLIDAPSLTVTATPAVRLKVDVSGDRRFVTVVPLDGFLGDTAGRVNLRIQGRYLKNLVRNGPRLEGGEVGGAIDASFDFSVRGAAPAATALTFPSNPGAPATGWELRRLALPLPSILPDYNQIGFDSLHYFITLVEGDASGGVAWMASARLAEGDNRTVIDPGAAAAFPLEVRYDGGLLTLVNDAGFSLELLGLNLGLGTFRIAARLDASGAAIDTAQLQVDALCGNITTYGPFLQQLGFCNPQTDILNVYGAAMLAPVSGGTRVAPAGGGTVDFTATPSAITATLAGSSLKVSEHAFGLLLIDANSGKPISLRSYGPAQATADASGNVATVRVPITRQDLPADLRIYLMIDGAPAARGLQMP